MSSVAARFFLPQIGGAGATPSNPSGVFRIDHDEQFNQTTHFQYQPWSKWPWFGFNWRYDSGLVAGAVSCYFPGDPSCPNSLTNYTFPNGSTSPAVVSMLAANYGAVPLSPDQEFQAGFVCNGVPAAPPNSTNRFGVPVSYGGAANVCPANMFTSGLVKIPAPNTEDDDKRPPRIQPRSLFDLAIGDDNVFHGDKYRWSAQLTVINIANNYALYNFLSTFSGTHYVTPRTVAGEIGFHF
jgi:hypothetical protein